MSNEDRQIFADAYGIYDQFRSIEMKEADWRNFKNVICQFAEKHKYKENPLAWRMGLMITDTLNDLYAGGKKPDFPGYFGRSDL
jgi:hypothetical protein